VAGEAAGPRRLGWFLKEEEKKKERWREKKKDRSQLGMLVAYS
jgi:hypothetical protein